MGKKRDFGPLLTAFQDRKSKPSTAAGQRGGGVRLPPLERLLQIDAAAEQAASVARIAVDASKQAGSTTDTAGDCVRQTGILGDGGMGMEYPPG